MIKIVDITFRVRDRRLTPCGTRPSRFKIVDITLRVMIPHA